LTANVAVACHHRDREPASNVAEHVAERRLRVKFDFDEASLGVRLDDRAWDEVRARRLGRASHQRVQFFEIAHLLPLIWRN
jgi:hypothetical protein